MRGSKVWMPALLLWTLGACADASDSAWDAEMDVDGVSLDSKSTTKGQCRAWVRYANARVDDFYDDGREDDSYVVDWIVGLPGSTDVLKRTTKIRDNETADEKGNTTLISSKSPPTLRNFLLGHLSDSDCDKAVLPVTPSLSDKSQWICNDKPLISFGKSFTRGKIVAKVAAKYRCYKSWDNPLE